MIETNWRHVNCLQMYIYVYVFGYAANLLLSNYQILYGQKCVVLLCSIIRKSVVMRNFVSNVSIACKITELLTVILYDWGIEELIK